MNLKFFHKNLETGRNFRDLDVYGRVTLKRGTSTADWNSKKNIQNQLTPKRPKGRLKARRKVDVENDTRKVGIGNWNK